jgi:hypothetical protein
MAAAAGANAGIAKVDTSFMDRSVVGGGVQNVGKAFIWTNAVSLSQAFGKSPWPPRRGR